MKRAALGLAAVAAALVGAVAFNTWRARPRPAAVTPLAFDAEAASHRLGAAVAIDTHDTSMVLVAASGNQADIPDRFAELHALLAQAYPRVHTMLVRERVDDASLLYTWRGSNAQCASVLLTAHHAVQGRPGRAREPARRRRASGRG